MLSSYGVMAEDIAISPDCFKSKTECETCAQNGVDKYSASKGANKFKVTKFREGSVCNFKVFNGKKKVAQSKDKQIKVKGFYCNSSNGKVKKIKVADLTSKYEGHTVYTSRSDAENDPKCKKSKYICAVKVGSTDVIALPILEGVSLPVAGLVYSKVGTKLHKKESKALKDRDCQPEKTVDPWVCAIKVNKSKVIAVRVENGVMPQVGPKYAVVGSTKYGNKNDAKDSKECEVKDPKFYVCVPGTKDTIKEIVAKNEKKANKIAKKDKSLDGKNHPPLYSSRELAEKNFGTDCPATGGGEPKVLSCYYCDPRIGKASSEIDVVKNYPKIAEMADVKTCADLDTKKEVKRSILKKEWKSIRKHLNKNKTLWQKIGSLFDNDALISLHESAAEAEAKSVAAGVQWCKFKESKNVCGKGYDTDSSYNAALAQLKKDETECKNKKKSGFEFSWIGEDGDNEKCVCKEKALSCSDEAKEAMNEFKTGVKEIPIKLVKTLAEYEAKVDEEVKKQKDAFNVDVDKIKSKFTTSEGYTYDGSSDVLFNLDQYGNACGAVEFKEEDFRKQSACALEGDIEIRFKAGIKFTDLGKNIKGLPENVRLNCVEDIEKTLLVLDRNAITYDGFAVVVKFSKNCSCSYVKRNGAFKSQIYKDQGGNGSSSLDSKGVSGSVKTEVRKVP